MKGRRKEGVNGSVTCSEMATDYQQLNGNRKTNGKVKNDESDTTTVSVESRERLSTRSYNKTSRGGPDRSAVIPEKAPSIEDAVYIYRMIMNSGTRPPIFLQRSLVYIAQARKRQQKEAKISQNLEGLVQRLSNMACVCSQVQLTLTNILNVKIVPMDRKEISIEFFLLKNCYKRRKTDITTKEKFLTKINLVTPYDLTAANHCITIDTAEISSNVGSHHMSACYLKAKVTVATERKSQPPNAKKAKKRYYPDVPEPKYRIKEYESTLLLHSGGKSYLPSGKQTLFLHEIDSGHQTAPQYMDWSDLNTTPQLVLDSLQLNHRRFIKSTSSPTKPSISTLHSTAAITDQSSSSSGQTTPPSSSSVPILADATGTNKLYFVLQYKGAPQTTVQVGYTCPFCLKKTRPSTLILLLKHLRLCHSRLLFLYKETEGEPAIIVTVNTYYDGSYCGNPLDIIPSLRQTPTTICESFKSVEPTRRTPYTEVLNIRADRRKLDLDEFAKPEPLPLISNSSSLLGHNRLYYHSISNQPVLSNDFDADSDGEDMEWGRVASSRLIDEFIDVNKGEKELMKLWNNFVSRNPVYISDVQMEGACLRFIREHSEVVSFKLRNNFLCHLATLYDAGVLQTKHVKTIIDAMPKKAATGVKGKAPINGHQQSLSKVKAEPINKLI